MPYCASPGLHTGAKCTAEGFGCYNLKAAGKERKTNKQKTQSAQTVSRTEIGGLTQTQINETMTETQKHKNIETTTITQRTIIAR